MSALGGRPSGPPTQTFSSPPPNATLGGTDLPDTLTKIEQSIEIDTDPQTVFDVLIDPEYVPVYAAGIEGAEIKNRKDDTILGAQLEMLTKSGNLLRATIVTADRPHEVAIEDERGTRSTWRIEPLGDRKVRLTNILEGPIPPAKADDLRYDADVKFQALAKALDGK